MNYSYVSLAGPFVVVAPPSFVGAALSDPRGSALPLLFYSKEVGWCSWWACMCEFSGEYVHVNTANFSCVAIIIARYVVTRWLDWGFITADVCVTYRLNTKILTQILTTNLVTY